jgi:hypothetical protein
MIERRNPAVKKLIAQPNGCSLQKETRPLQEGRFDSIHGLAVNTPHPNWLFN